MFVKYCCAKLGNRESFCGTFERLWEIPDRLGPTETSELWGKSSVKVWAIFRGTCVSLIWESSWRISGGRVGKYLVKSESRVGSLGTEGIWGGVMPFSLKNALMLSRHSEVKGMRIRQLLNASQLTGATEERGRQADTVGEGHCWLSDSNEASQE